MYLKSKKINIKNDVQKKKHLLQMKVQLFLIYII